MNRTLAKQTLTEALDIYDMLLEKNYSFQHPMSLWRYEITGDVFVFHNCYVPLQIVKSSILDDVLIRLN